eukprot:TRINITY_DN3476_c0_g5_i1.p1 TRINITY_DN3476_c0_g5~~TRINITY_DN3476_c0_g5_i1.p1  ORF type:complete len:121 (-),score=3.62 TRINITY_DN3476_c0_g5_i1:68-430(-)
MSYLLIYCSCSSSYSRFLSFFRKCFYICLFFLLLQGKFNEAVSALQTAVDLDPRFTDAYCNLGSTFKAIHEIDNAIKCFTTAISVAPGLPDPYAHLAHAFLVSFIVFLPLSFAICSRCFI